MSQNKDSGSKVKVKYSQRSIGSVLRGPPHVIFLFFVLYTVNHHQTIQCCWSMTQRVLRSIVLSHGREGVESLNNKACQLFPQGQKTNQGQVHPKSRSSKVKIIKGQGHQRSRSSKINIIQSQGHPKSRSSNVGMIPQPK